MEAFTVSTEKKHHSSKIARQSTSGAKSQYDETFTVEDIMNRLDRRNRTGSFGDWRAYLRTVHNRTEKQTRNREV
jgi:hypothetical protein